MRHQIIFLYTFSLFLLFGLCGCFSSNPEDINAFVRPWEQTVSAEDYVLQPPDEIEIHCSKVPELHLQRQRIRPDGKVGFEGLGQVDAAGRTPGQLAEILKEKIMGLYSLVGENPIDVRVVAFRSKVYYVLGQVDFPGVKISSGRDTVFRALSAAQPNVLAWVGRIQVIRPSSGDDDGPKIFEVDFSRMRAHGDLSKNVLLQEGDVIYVPPTVVASIALKVEEFVRPIGRAFSTVNIVQGPNGN